MMHNLTQLAATFAQERLELFGVYQIILRAGEIHGGTQYGRTIRNALLIPLRGAAQLHFTDRKGRVSSLHLQPGRAMIGGFDRYLLIEIGTEDFEYVMTHYLPGELPADRGVDAAGMPQAEEHLLHDLHELVYEPNGALLQLIGELRKANSLPPGLSQLEKKTKFYQIINWLLTASAALQNGGKPSELEQIIAYIHHHYMQPLTLAQLAEKSGFRPKYFAKLFQRCTGYSPLNYLIQVRMDIAHDMLASGFYTVREVADHVGYSDPYYFSRLFKSRKGISPSAFKGKD